MNFVGSVYCLSLAMRHPHQYKQTNNKYLKEKLSSFLVPFYLELRFGFLTMMAVRAQQQTPVKEQQEVFLLHSLQLWFAPLHLYCPIRSDF